VNRRGPSHLLPKEIINISLFIGIINLCSEVLRYCCILKSKGEKLIPFQSNKGRTVTTAEHSILVKEHFIFCSVKNVPVKGDTCKFPSRCQ